MGISLTDTDIWVATEDGSVVPARTLKLLPGADCVDAKLVLGVRGVSWEPRPGETVSRAAMAPEAMVPDEGLPP